jgi:hypothetical protein
VVIAGAPLLASGSTYGLYGMSVEHASQDNSGTLYGMKVAGTGTWNPGGGDFIGQFRLTFQANLPYTSPPIPSATPPPGYGVISSSFIAYCMELDVGIGIADKGAPSFAKYTFSMTDTVPQKDRAYASQPWLNGPEQASYLYNTYGSKVYDGRTDLERDVAAAALQAAIWTSLYGEAMYNVSSGSGAQQAVYSLWSTYMNDAQWTNQPYNSSWWQGTDGDGTIQQGLIGPGVVPEPKETGILCGLFLTGLLGWEIWRRTTRSAQRPP